MSGPRMMETATGADYHRQGERELQDRQYAAAMASFDKAINLGQRSLATLDLKAAAMSYMDEGWRRSALELVNKCLVTFKRDKRVWKLWYRKADILLLNSDYATAVSALDSASATLDRLTPDSRLKAVGLIDRLREKIKAAHRAARQRQIALARESAAEKARREALEKKRVRLATTNFIKLLPRDVVLLIAECGVRMDPGSAITMAATCKDWREVIVNQPGLWRTLVLSDRRPTAKTQMWVQRSRGRIDQVRFTEKFDPRHSHGVADILEGSADRVKTVSVMNSIPALQPKTYRGKFTNIQSLTFGLDDQYIQSFTLPLYILPSSPTPSLRHLSVENARMDGNSGVRFWEGQEFWTPFDDWSKEISKLGSLETVRIEASVINSPLHANFPQRTPRASFLAYLANVQHVEFLDNSWNIAHPTPAQQAQAQAAAGAGGASPNQQPFNQTETICLPHLRSYSDKFLGDMETEHLFHHIKAPKLTSLSLWDSRGLVGGHRVMDEVMAHGLEEARPNLESLDIGKSPVDQDALIRLLRRLPSLRFLNVSYCGLDNSFLDAIQLKDGVPDEDQILPHLSALSIAGSPEITTGAVRDFLNSRLPRSDRIPQRLVRPPSAGLSMFKPTKPAPASKSKVETKAKVKTMTASLPPHQQQRVRLKWRSASQRDTNLLLALQADPSMSVPEFLPTASPSASAPASASASPSLLETLPGLAATQVLSASTSLSTQQFPFTIPASQLPVNPRIDWLNIDQCENIEYTAVELWRSKVRFISNSLGPPNYDRIRGKGRWTWQGDWTDDCERAGSDEEGRCHLRRVPGTSKKEDQWQVWHVCKPKQQEPWLGADADADADVEPSQGEGELEGGQGKGKGKGKGKVGVKGWYQMPKRVDPAPGRSE